MDKTKETGNQVYRSYQDRLFRMVFREKKELRSWSNGRTIYGRQLVKIPTPRFFVFYNGRDMQPERQVLKLSDAFMNPEEDPALELKVVMLNINLGRNKELMEQCHTLLEYAQFVDRLRMCEKSMGREEAVKHTVDTCIGEGKLVGEEQRLFRQVCTKLKKGKTPEVIGGGTGRRSFTNTIHLRGGRRICAGI